ncbi:hypothetical protein DFH29DRAFT_1004604 [Suillus ampliporus]|nr:hypothetical protein DFH29DRAFT_1004604 [Suillus ampliporus]
MPSFSSSSSIRAASEHRLLNVKIVHKLYHISPSNVVHKVRGRLPKELDVLLFSDLIFSISGSLDGQKVPADVIAHSALMRHLRNDLNANAPQLGLNNISDAYIDEDDGHAKITLTPSRSLSYTSRPHAILVAVDLCYIWKTAGDRQDSTNLLSDASPFSDHLYLPFELLLKRVTEQFFTNQLVGRYPLIFGTWCRRLDMEAEYFPSVAQSILEITRRSPNPHFVARCKATNQARHQSVLQTSAEALSLCFTHRNTEDSDEGKQISASSLTPEAVLCESLEQIFRAGVPQTRFKSQVITSRSTLLTSSAGDDDQLLEDGAIFNNTEVDFPFTWHNLPEFHMDISAPVVDMQQTVPNDMDDLLEDWPEEASLGATFPGAWITHSDGSSLSDGSFALNLEPDQEDATMEDAEFARIVFHPSLLCHQTLYSRVGADVTFLECQEQPGELEFDVLVDDTEFEDEEWSCEDEMLFDLGDVLDDSCVLCVEDETGPLCVSQAPDGGPDQDVFLQVKSNAADQEYAFDTHFGMDGQVVQGGVDDHFTDVWDL